MPEFAVLVHASKESESGQTPTAAELAEMGAFNKPYLDSGVIRYAGGFLASSKNGARVSYSDGASPKVQDGPLALENLISGFWVLKLDTFEEALDFAKKAPFKGGKVDVRQIAGVEDFGDALSEDSKEQMKKQSGN